MPDASDRAAGSADAEEAGDDADVLVTGPGWRQWPVWRRWCERWRASATSAQVLMISALVAALAALGILALAERTQPNQRIRTVYAAAKPGAVTVDAAGCPVRVRCAVLVQVDPLLVAALHRTFPGVEVASSVVVRDAASGQTYRRVLVARSARTSLIVAVQCIPGTSPGPRRVLRATPATSAGRSLATFPQRLEVIVAGRAGCSASVEVDAAGRNPPDAAPALALAGDPALLAAS